MNNIRNFCILAHIDHGKSTLADRFLELTQTVDKRKMKNQILDQMELERERGITIKLQPARMQYKDYILNLIDTPGHVDFTYEVSRSLAAVEGALLVVDATQGVQAQTLANLYLAIEQGLEIIPVINKIDLPNAEVERTQAEIIDILGCKEQDILQVSAKTGQGVEKILDAIIEKIPVPSNRGTLGQDVSADNILQALIFDSKFDDYRGVIAYVRIFNGQVKKGDEIYFIGTNATSEVVEVGYFKPNMQKADKLSSGEIGYIVTGFKEVRHCRVGDTVTFNKSETISHKSKIQLPGYKEAKPMVFAGIFCQEGSDYKILREALDKLKLTDASLIFEPESSPVLGFGFRCGFLGLLHLEIIQERLKREFDLELVVTVPSVAYHVTLKGGKTIPNNNGTMEQWNHGIIIHSPQELPDPACIESIEEPWVKIDIITPKEYIGNLMGLVQEKRGIYKNTEYLSGQRSILHYEIPLSSILVDFYDKLKSVSSGYASLNYELIGYRQADVVRLDILIAEKPQEALASIVYKDEAYQVGRQIVDKLKETLPRQLFEIKIQACLGAQVIASSRIPPLRKDVTAKLYGGDVTRKRKLLEKQKKGKKRMRSTGKVQIPTEAYLAVLRR